MSDPSAQTLFSRLVWPIALAMLALFASACLYVAGHTSPTFDEPDQLATGYHALRWFGHPDSDPGVESNHAVFTNQDLRFTQMWEALPLLVFQPQPHFPSFAEQQKLSGFNFGRIFMFNAGNDTEKMVFWSRAMVTLLSVGLGLTIFIWSRRLWGELAGLVSLAFYCSNPLVIAHSSVATTDLATTFFYLLAGAQLWRLLHRVSVGNVLLAGLFAGLLGASKITGVLLFPVAGLLLVMRMLVRQPMEVCRPGSREVTTRPPSWWLLLGALAAAVVVAYITVWGVYGFRYPIGAHAQTEPWAVNSALQLGFAAPIIQFCRNWHILPEAYLYDLQLFISSGSLRQAFLHGDYSLNGWWYFFPVAFVVKTPLPFLVALVAAAVVAVRSRVKLEPMFYRLTPLLVLSAVYGGVALVGNLNIGVRHLLPLHPLLFILAGLLACLPLATVRARALWIASLLLWSVVEVSAVAPHYLAYFNELAGGPAEGHRWLVDSSYDWGEELPDLQRWLNARADRGVKRPIYFSYFGVADLAHYNITPVPDYMESPGDDGRHVVQLPSFYDQRPIQRYQLEPGTYLISATMLHSMYGQMTFGPWRPSMEDAYQSLAKEMDRLQQAMKNGKSSVDDLFRNDGRAANSTYTADQAFQLGAQIWTRKVRLFDELRFSRLCAYLRRREPEDRIGYGILVYELTTTELNKALNDAPAELRQNYVIKGSEKFNPDQIGFIK